MNIEFENGRTVSRNVWFTGALESGIGFTVLANWDEHDDWTVDDILWDEGEGTEEDREAITERFLEEMNG
jgi:hypothetical protein